MLQRKEPTSQSPGSGRLLVWMAAAAVVAVSAVTTALLWPEPDRKRADTVPAPPKTAAPSVSAWAPVEQLVTPKESRTVVPVALDAGRRPTAPQPEQRTADFFSGPAPELIERAYDVVSSGRRLHSKRVKEVYEYGKTHPDDPRPQLLLAMDSMNRGWYGFASDHYVRAVKADAEAANDPRVMRDLIRIASRKHDSDEAREALVDIYGRGALAAVQQATEDARAQNDSPTEARLSDLAEVLQALPDPE